MKTRMMQRAYAGIQPGAEDMLLTATGDYLDRLTDYLDHDCASDAFRVPDEVSAIIQEEISACLGGASTPEKSGRTSNPEWESGWRSIVNSRMRE